jgi:hypothetical protein
MSGEVTTQPNKPKTRINFAALDMLGSSVAFNVKGDETYKTIVGCLFTLGVLLGVVIITVYYMLIFKNKSDKTVITTMQIEQNYPIIDFYKNGLFFTLHGIENNMIVKLEEKLDALKIEATF